MYVCTYVYIYILFVCFCGVFFLCLYFISFYLFINFKYMHQEDNISNSISSY